MRERVHAYALRLYESLVMSVFTYGCEWSLGCHVKEDEAMSRPLAPPADGETAVVFLDVATLGLIFCTKGQRAVW